MALGQLSAAGSAGTKEASVLYANGYQFPLAGMGTLHETLLPTIQTAEEALGYLVDTLRGVSTDRAEVLEKELRGMEEQYYSPAIDTVPNPHLGDPSLRHAIQSIALRTAKIVVATAALRRATHY